jgi:3-(3-hydroxy-phenyl)propionate hydroxylase
MFRADYVIGADCSRHDRRASASTSRASPGRRTFSCSRPPKTFSNCSAAAVIAITWPDPDEWTNLFKVAGDDGKGRWRAVFPTRVEKSDEEALGDESTYSRLQRVFPLTRRYNVVHPISIKYTSASPPRFAKGEFFSPAIRRT